jgi:hypothetical protein
MILPFRQLLHQAVQEAPAPQVEVAHGDGHAARVRQVLLQGRNQLEVYIVEDPGHGVTPLPLVSLHLTNMILTLAASGLRLVFSSYDREVVG